MNLKNLAVAFTVIALIILSTACGTDEKTEMSQEKNNKQVDNFAGSIAVLEPDVAEMDNVTDDQMHTFEAVIRKRLDTNGYYEATISLEENRQVRIEIPNNSDPDIINEILLHSPKLEFADADGNIIMDGSKKFISGAEYKENKSNSNGATEHCIEISFTDKGRETFKKATEAASQAETGKNYISIMLDGVVIMSPSVAAVIDSDVCIISGNYTKDEAQKVAMMIDAAQLPFSIKIVAISVVD